MNDTGVKSTADKIYQAIIIIILCLFDIINQTSYIRLVIFLMNRVRRGSIHLVEETNNFHWTHM